MRPFIILFFFLIAATSLNSGAAVFHSEEMHPSRGLYLEHIFYRIASVVCDGSFDGAKDMLFAKALEKDNLGSEIFLNLIQGRCEHVKKTPQQLHADVAKHIASTREYINNSSRLASFLGPFLNPLFNVAEPVRSKNGRIDGFVLYASDIYLKTPQEFLKRLSNMAKDESFDPFVLLRESIQNPNSEISMGLLSLLTHNHQAEFQLIANVIANDGVDSAWRAYLNLNKLYELERQYWQKRLNLLCNEKYLQALSYEDENENLEYRACYSQITYGHLTIDVPVVKSYHFYGAWIMSYRLKKQGVVPNALIPAAVSGMIGSYKKQTHGDRNRDIIVDLYDSTAKLFLAQSIPSL